MPLSIAHPSNGQTPKTVSADPAKQQRRVVRRLLRDLVALTGPVINDLATTPRSAPRRTQQTRVLFRRADRLSDADVDRLIREVGAGRLMAALDRWTQPRFTIATE
jgi:hypothetical protein